MGVILQKSGAGGGVSFRYLILYIMACAGTEIQPEQDFSGLAEATED